MGFEIKKAVLQNYGQLQSFSCDRFSNINLIIGENGTGKTYLLKALYSTIRTIEEYKRGDDVRKIGEILSEKLRWTFQVDKLGDMVTQPRTDKLLSFDIGTSENSLHYHFSAVGSSKMTVVSSQEENKTGNSVFIPAKEVLSLFSVILKSREIDRYFGFDDTYYDLAKALRITSGNGDNDSKFAAYRKKLSSVINGKVEFDENSGKWWYYKEGKKRQKISIGATSEGVKKLAIMDRLLSNGYLDKNSVVFIDELESALHPAAICDFLDMISMIANEMGIQVFITSHSYFVVKKLFLVALKNPDSVTCISLSKNQSPVISNLSEGIPENSIIQTSIDLYEQELDEVL